MRNLSIAGATLNQTPLDWKGNVRRIVDTIQEAKNQNVDILCFPELSLTAYGCQDLFLSEWLSEKAELVLPQIISNTKGILVAIGLPVRLYSRTYNCVCVISNEKILGITAKQFLPIDGVHYETRWFKEWPAAKITQIDFCSNQIPFGDVIYNHHGISFGFEICEDAWREDRPGLRLSDRSVDLILNPSASHFALQKTLERQELVTNSSKIYNCVYVYANLLGNEAGRMIYDGEILIADKGRLLARNEHLSFQEFNLLTLTIDFDNKDILEEMAIEALPKEEEFTRAVSLGLYDYLRKSNASGFVLSLSGGADSASCAVLVSEMLKRVTSELGLDEVTKSLRLQNYSSDSNNIKPILHQILTCVYQSSNNSSEETLHSAKSLADDIGASFHSWSIDDEVRGFTSKIEEAMKKPLDWSSDDIALQNIQARTRSPIIWMMANVKSAILLTTSNRSEGSVGYATMDGDTSGSLAPIAGIDKPFIRDWLVWAQNELGYSSLDIVNNLTPTAELRPGGAQSDETDLMPYTLLQQIERLAIKDHLSPKEVYLILKQNSRENPEILKTYVAKFFKLWSQNQWKRERLATSFHLDEYNVDPKTWCRFPIISGGFNEEIQELENT